MDRFCSFFLFLAGVLVYDVDGEVLDVSVMVDSKGRVKVKEQGGVETEFAEEAEGQVDDQVRRAEGSAEDRVDGKVPVVEDEAENRVDDGVRVGVNDPVGGAEGQGCARHGCDGQLQTPGVRGGGSEPAGHQRIRVRVRIVWQIRAVLQQLPARRARFK